MKILIVEDESLSARNIELSCWGILGSRIESVQIIKTLKEACTHLLAHSTDLCILDLDQDVGKGYELLNLAFSKSFQTIIISGQSDLAIEAFKYDVLDFIPMPFDEDRLRLAFKRYSERIQNHELTAKCLPVRRGKENYLIFVDDIEYIQADRMYVEAHLKNGRHEILNKSMNKLEKILPSEFMRIHRSYIVDIQEIEAYQHLGGGKYQVVMKNGEIFPLSRQKVDELRNRLNL